MCNYCCKFANKIIMFQEALKFKDVIILCYNRQNIVRISGRMSSLFTWHISQIIVNYFSPIVSVCVLNQFNSHWLLSNALQYVIIMCLKCKKEIANSPTLTRWLMMILELFLSCLCFLLISKREIAMFKIFPFFFKKIWKKKISQHFMFNASR
jgi:hypothetical protein